MLVKLKLYALCVHNVFNQYYISVALWRLALVVTIVYVLLLIFTLFQVSTFRLEPLANANVLVIVSFTEC